MNNSGQIVPAQPEWEIPGQPGRYTAPRHPIVQMSESDPKWAWFYVRRLKRCACCACSTSVSAGDTTPMTTGAVLVKQCLGRRIPGRVNHIIGQGIDLIGCQFFLPWRHLKVKTSLADQCTQISFGTREQPPNSPWQGEQLMANNLAPSGATKKFRSRVRSSACHHCRPVRDGHSGVRRISCAFIQGFLEFQRV